VIAAWKTYSRKLFTIEALDSHSMQDDFSSFVDKNATLEAKKDEKYTMHVNALTVARNAILDKDPATYFESVKDIYLPILDKEVPTNYLIFFV
jgi:hypothetical protein